MFNANHTVAHHLTASLIQTIYQTIMKHPQNDRHLYFEAGRWFAGNTYEDAGSAAMEEQYLPTVPVQAVPVHHTEIFRNSVAEPDSGQGIVQTADSRLCTGELAS